MFLQHDNSCSIDVEIEKSLNLFIISFVMTTAPIKTSSCPDSRSHMTPALFKKCPICLEFKYKCSTCGVTKCDTCRKVICNFCIFRSPVSVIKRDGKTRSHCLCPFCRSISTSFDSVRELWEIEDRRKNPAFGTYDPQAQSNLLVTPFDG